MRLKIIISYYHGDISLVYCRKERRNKNVCKDANYLQIAITISQENDDKIEWNDDMYNGCLGFYVYNIMERIVGGYT